MKKYLAIIPNLSSDKNLIFTASNFDHAKITLKSYIKKDTMFQDIKLIELDTLKTKIYFIEKI